MSRILRQRLAIAWLCFVATLLLGFTAQQHGLAHALGALQLPAHHDLLAGHAQGCEQCLQLACADTALPVAMPALHHAVSALCEGDEAIAPWRIEAFTAYTSRAPPRRG